MSFLSSLSDDSKISERTFILFLGGAGHRLVSKLPSCMWGPSQVMRQSPPYRKIWRCHRLTFPASFKAARGGAWGQPGTPTPVLELVALGLEKQGPQESILMLSHVRCSQCLWSLEVSMAVVLAKAAQVHTGGVHGASFSVCPQWWKERCL